MRELSNTLKTAQQARALNPLYKIMLTKGENTYTYDKTRILPSEHDEEMYSHRAKIVLTNHDGEVNDKDLKGCDAVIYYGVVSKVGEEYSATAPLSVIDQQFDSDPNKLTCTLELEGIPDLMAEDNASEVYMPDDTDTKTVKDLVDAIVGATLAPFTHCKAFEVVWDEGYDSLADSYKPKDGFRVYTGGSRLAALRRVLDFTANVPRFGNDGKVHILKPLTTGTSYDYEYSLQKGDHVFFSKAYRNSLVFPNRVVVRSRDDDDPQYSSSAQVDGYDSLPDKVKKTEFVQAKLESNDQAQDIAEALIAKAEMGCKKGQAEVPLNVGAEVFDYVKVTDQRQGDTRTGNLGYVHRRFGIDKWVMTFGFGNWLEVLRYRAMFKELETYTDAGQYFSRLSVKDLYAENIMAENMNFIWLDPDNTIDLSKIGDNLDNLPDGEVYARVKTLHLDAGQLKLDENVLYSPGYDPSTKWEGEDLDDLPDGTTYQRVKSAALSASGLILLDEVIAGTYGLIYSADLSAHHVKLSACSGDLDDVDNGGTYGKLRLTDMSGGHLLLSSYTQVSGEWYDESGVEIDASHGINIYGQNNALTTRATKTGTIQCYVGSDGKIYAGGGDVVLGSDGVRIYGELLRFYYGTSYRGYLAGSSSALNLHAATGYGVSIAGNYISVVSVGSGEDIVFTVTGLAGIDMSNPAYLLLPTYNSNPGGVGAGAMYYNTSTTKLMVYAEGAWRSVQLS